MDRTRTRVPSIFVWGIHDRAVRKVVFFRGIHQLLCKNSSRTGIRRFIYATAVSGKCFAECSVTAVKTIQFIYLVIIIIIIYYFIYFIIIIILYIIFKKMGGGGGGGEYSPTVL